MVDEFTRECLAIDVARRLNSEDVLERPTWLFVTRGVPKHPKRQWARVYGANGTRLAETDRLQHTLHRAGKSVGERLRGELQRQAPRR